MLPTHTGGLGEAKDPFNCLSKLLGDSGNYFKWQEFLLNWLGKFKNQKPNNSWIIFELQLFF